MKIVKNFEINLRLQKIVEGKNAEQKIQNEECKFIQSLRSLILHFPSKMAHHFLLNL